MGLSTQKSTQKQTQTVAPTAYSQPYVDSAAATLKPGYDESMKAAQQYQPGLLAASNYYGDVLGGSYLDRGPSHGESPYLEGVVQSTNRDISDTVNGAFNSRFGSGYHAKTLAKSLADNENNLRYGDAVRRDAYTQDNYARERGYQNQAGQNIAATAATATALPMIPSQGYAQGVSGLLGRYMNADGTNVTKSSPSILQMLGMGLQGASLFA